MENARFKDERAGMIEQARELVTVSDKFRKTLATFTCRQRSASTMPRPSMAEAWLVGQADPTPKG